MVFSYIYIYIYIYIYWQHFFIDIYLIEHYRHFFVNPFELPYQSYDIRRESVDKPFIISYFPKYFLPNPGPLSWEDVEESSTPFHGLLHLPLIHTLSCWVLSKEATSNIFFLVFGMTWPKIESQSPGQTL